MPLLGDQDAKETLPVVLVLLEAGANPNAWNDSVETPLAPSGRQEQRGFRHRAPEIRGPIQMQVTTQAPPLSQAAGREDGVGSALLSLGVDPHVQDNLGCTPLYYTASSGNLPLVEALPRPGASPLFAQSIG